MNEKASRMGSLSCLDFFMQYRLYKLYSPIIQIAIGSTPILLYRHYKRNKSDLTININDISSLYING